MPIVTFADLPEPNEVTYAEGRLTTRTYASKSFTAAFGQDQGHPSRYIYRVPRPSDRIMDKNAIRSALACVFLIRGDRR